MFHRLEFRAMGTRILAIVDSASVPSILEDVPAWFEEWEQNLSRFRLDSELSLLNSRTGMPQVVSPTLWEVYRAALDAERLTGGLVNPLVLNAVIRAGYDRSFDCLMRDTRGALSARIYDDGLYDERRGEDLPPPSSLKVHSSRRTLCIPEGTGLDFGGIAKGWAASQAMQRLQQAGPALVSAGGDVAVSGVQSNGDAWPIGVEDPFREGAYLDTIYLERGGVATSGRDHRYWTRNGVPQHHVIDPRTGMPAQTDILTATVIAGTAMTAEALAKAVMISGSHAGLAWLDSDENLAGLLVLESGRTLYSRNIEKYL